jgi:hypothetical protein
MMKKILVVLLVLAVATGVFAQQGEWTVSGSAKLDTDISFMKEDNPFNTTTTGINPGSAMSDGSTSNAATVWATHYGDVGVNGNVDLAYQRDGAKLYLGFGISEDAGDGGGTPHSPNFSEGGKLNAGVEFYGDRYAFQAESPVWHMLTAGEAPFGDSFSKLWGYYKLLNEMIHLEVAYKDRGETWWAANDTGRYANWTDTDGRNLLLTDVGLGNLNFGIQVPNLFFHGGNTVVDGNGTVYSPVPYEFINDVLKESVFGLKFNMAPITAAAQFKFKGYGAYFGIDWAVGPLTLGGSFQGEFEHNQHIRAGAKAEYGADVFGAAVAVWLERQKADWNPLTQVALPEVYVGQDIGVEPSFWYNVFPETMKFKTSVGLFFHSLTKDGQKQTLPLLPDFDVESITWSVTPELTWNFLQTGAMDIGDISTGMGVKYTLSYKAENMLYVGFKFAF